LLTFTDLHGIQTHGYSDALTNNALSRTYMVLTI